jgi:hypothetical protein
LSSRPTRRGRPAPLYIVCSPLRGVGKTLVARLLIELYLIEGRDVAAFDLADEGPQLADYLPGIAAIADIGETRGQMALFDRILAGNGAVTVIDLPHRALRNFFAVAQKIGFFQEARRAAIEPLLLFLVGHDPTSAKVYALLRRWLSDASMLPVRNKSEARAPAAGAIGDAAMDGLDIAPLDFPLRAQIDQRSFSFRALWQGDATYLSEAMEDSLQEWTEHTFVALGKLEHFLGCAEQPLGVASARSGCVVHRRRARHATHWRSGPPEVAIDRSGNAIIAMLEQAGGRLAAAQARIGDLMTEVESTHERAARAEAWLHLLESEIVDRLVVRPQGS